MRLFAIGLVALVLQVSCASRETPAPPPAPAPPRTAPPRAASLPDASAPPPSGCGDDPFGLAEGGEARARANIEAKRGTSGKAAKTLVVTSHPRATEAALAVLRAGGSAADAFVAAVLVQDVVLPGVTSTAGLAGVLVWDAKAKKATYVHGGVADPVDPARRFRHGDTAAGKLVLVPGAPAAYAVLVERFGKKPLAFDVEPAAKTAEEGFALDALYARSLARSKEVLERSEYGKRTFFPGGRPVAEGETLKVPEVAKALRGFGKDPRFFHGGKWAAEAVALAAKNGGALRVEDFTSYAVEVAPAMHGTFLGHDVFAGAHGGLKALASLGAIERLRGAERPEAPASSLVALERIVRVQRAAATLPALPRRDLVATEESFDVGAAADTVAAMVRRGEPVAPPPRGGTHSSAAIVVDAEGNVVVGTHTIETLNWGGGLFVSGIPLSTSARIAFDDPATATRPMRVDPLSAMIALKGGAPRLALTVYGTGLHPADVQIADAVLARGLSAEDAVLEPRVGYFVFDPEKHDLDTSTSVVDPRFPAALLCAAREHGLRLTRSAPGYPPGIVDTGFPTLVTFGPDGLHGMPPDAAAIHGVAKGD